MNILLTGGTGNVGRTAVTRLVNNGHTVRVIGRRPDVTLEGAEVLEQRARQVVNQVPAMSAAPVRWLVRGKAGTLVEIRASAPGLGTVQLAVDLERQGGQR